jgi:hypothetical protein
MSVRISNGSSAIQYEVLCGFFIPSCKQQDLVPFKPFTLYQSSCTLTTLNSWDRRKIKHRESDITLTFNEGKLSQFVMEDKRELMIWHFLDSRVNTADGKWKYSFMKSSWESLRFFNRTLWYTYVIRTNKMHTFYINVSI